MKQNKDYISILVSSNQSIIHVQKLSMTMTYQHFKRFVCSRDEHRTPHPETLTRFSMQLQNQFYIICHYIIVTTGATV